VLALALVAFVLNLNTNVLGALLPYLPGELTDAGRGSALLAGAAWPSALAALAVGPLADRAGRRKMALLGLLAFAVASLLHLPLPGYNAFYAARALSGAAVGVAYASAAALLAEVVPYERRGRAMGAFTAGMFLALPVGLPLATLFARSGSWRAIFAVQAGFALLAVVLLVRGVPRQLGAPAGFGEHRPRLVRYRDVLAQASVKASMLAVMLHVGAFFVTVQLSSGWLHDTGYVVREDQAWLWITLGVAAAIGSLGFASLADRFGKRRFVLLSSVVLVSAFVALALVENRAAVVLVGLLIAVAASARTGPLQALMSGLVPAHHYATLMGLRAFSMQMGVALFALAAPLCGAMSSGSPFLGVLLAAAACQALSWLAIWRGVREVQT
jgi:DHA1 family inner membrane transport protein